MRLGSFLIGMGVIAGLLVRPALAQNSQAQTFTIKAHAHSVCNLSGVQSVQAANMALGAGSANQTVVNIPSLSNAQTAQLHGKDRKRQRMCSRSSCSGARRLLRAASGRRHRRSAQLLTVYNWIAAGASSVPHKLHGQNIQHVQRQASRPGDEIMSIGFVIVTFNSERVLPGCLESIPEGCNIVVVDNASKDRSPQIAQSFGASVIVNDSNGGFAKACNQGARALSASHVFFLNPDTVLAPDAVARIEEAIGQHPGYGAFGPAIQVQRKRQKFRSTSYIGNRGEPYAVKSPPNEVAEVEFLDGAALVCDLALFWGLGGFDERLFLYYDDDDLCFRIRSRGKRLLYVPEARVFHERNASCGKSLRLDYLRSFHAARSRVYISSKYRIPIDVRHEKRRAAILLCRSVASLNLRKAARSWGTLSALT